MTCTCHKEIDQLKTRVQELAWQQVGLTEERNQTVSRLKARVQELEAVGNETVENYQVAVLERDRYRRELEKLEKMVGDSAYSVKMICERDRYREALEKIELMLLICPHCPAIATEALREVSDE